MKKPAVRFCVTQSDEAVVEKARRVLAAKRKLRWLPLLYAAVFLGFTGYLTAITIQKIENLDPEQLKAGFVFGLALAVVWTTFGVAGGFCLAKFLMGFTSEFRLQDLLVRYHDRLRDLGQLPVEDTALESSSES